MELQTYRVHLVWLSTITCSVLLVCAFLNWYIDPYDFFNRSRIDGVNALKPTADTRVRFGKPYRVALLQPKTVIMGNSRPEMGLDPAYNCWPDGMYPIYNLSMPGMGLYAIYRNFQHALSVSNVEYLILGLDFLFFTPADKNVDPYTLDMPARDFKHLHTFSDGTNNSYYSLERAKNIFRALFSLQTVVDSINTLRLQSNQFTPTINPDGYNPGGKFLEIVATEGQQVLFAQKNREVAEMLVGEKFLFQGGKTWSRSLEIMQRILEVAKEHGTKTVLFINPRHADFLNLLDISGKWGLLDDWKRIMTRVVEPYDAQLWDFHGFNEYSITAPPTQKGQVLDGFWEPGHYRSAMGNAVIDTVFENPCNKTAMPHTGALLNTGNIERHLADLRTELSLYEEQQPEEKQSLKDLFDRVARDKISSNSHTAKMERE